MQIECSVQNTNSLTFQNLQIKKIRQVLFLNSARDRIDIYTALLVGGSQTKSSGGNRVLSRLSKDFNLVIEFNASDNGEVCEKITTEDKTSDFFGEIDKIRKLWGKSTEEIRTQEKLADLLKNIVTTVEPQKTNIRNKKYILVAEENRLKEGIIACEGSLGIDEKGYSVSTEQELHEGVEIISWVKTSIFLKEKFSSKERIEYSLRLPQENGKESNLSYISIYLCPCEGYHLEEDSSVSYYVNDKRINSEEKNNIMPVSKDTSIYYKEWEEEHQISNRRIYRLNKEKIFKSYPQDIECGTLSIEFEIAPDTEKGSTQFVMGALFSALITYGVDSGRLAVVKPCFLPIVPPDIQWFLMCFVISLAFLRWCSKKEKASEISNNKADKKSGCLYRIGVAISIIWIFYTFVIYRLELSIIKTIIGMIPAFVIPCIGLVAVVLLMIYIILTFTLLKKNYYKKPLSKENFF